MSFSADEIARALEEIAPWCREARIQDIWLAGGNDLYLELYKDRARQVLLFSAHPKGSRLHFTEKPPRTGRPPEGFVQLLRARILGARILRLLQVPGERIVRAEIHQVGEVPADYCLLAELFGPRANLLLLDGSGRIRGSLRPRGPSGTLWIAPQAPERRPSAAREFENSPGTSFSRRAAAHYDAFLTAAEADSERTALRRAASRERDRLERLEKKLLAEIEESRQEPLLREKGELLKAHGRKVPARADSFEAERYSSPGETLRIELDPSLTAARNADRYFDRARRARRTGEEAGRRLQEARDRLESVRAVGAALESEETPSGGTLARAAALGLPRPPGPKMPEGLGEAPVGERFSKAFEKLKIRPRRFESESGYSIFVGRTDAENDILTMRFAKPQDYFFHVAGAPGSHVIVCLAKGEELDPVTRFMAAQLALRYSALGKSGRGEVHYLRRKYVRKRKGDPAGLVHLASPPRTLWAEIKEENPRKNSRGTRRP